MARIGFVTCAQFREMAVEDDLLVEALQARGHRTERPNWDSPDTPWQDYDALVIRSTWDYQWRLPEFLSWVDRIEAAQIPLYNPPAVLRWNSTKAYLRELHLKGVPIPPTEWTDAGRDWSLSQVMDSRGWEQVVVKPMVGAGAFHTFAVSRPDADNHEANNVAELRDRGVIVQEFLPEIAADGEWSLLFFAGDFSHAIIKRPQAGDFRVQEHHGGTYQPVRPSPDIVAQAKRILKHAPGELLYARVDGIIRDRQFLLIELEVFEPWFFLSFSEHGTAKFLTALEQRILRDGEFSF